MAVVRVSEKFAQAFDGASRDTLTKTYTRVLEVECDSQADGPLTIQPHLPAYGAAYVEANGASDPTAVLRGIGIRRRSSASPENGHAVLWLATLTYEFVPVEAQINNDPTGNGYPPPQRGIGFIKVAEVRQFDDDDEPDVNTAGQLFDPPVEDERILGQDTVSWAAPTFNYDFARGMIGGVNDAPYWGKEEGTLRLDNATAEERYTAGGVRYQWITATVTHDPKGFDRKILNAGMMQLVDLGGGAGLVLRPCVGTDGQPVTSPVPLDADGKQLDLTNVDPSQYKDYVIYKTKKVRRIAFGALGIP